MRNYISVENMAKKEVQVPLKNRCSGSEQIARGQKSTLQAQRKKQKNEL